jgi:hypothetical protein
MKWTSRLWCQCACVYDNISWYCIHILAWIKVACLQHMCNDKSTCSFMLSFEQHTWIVTWWCACAYFCMVMISLMPSARCMCWSFEQHMCNVNVHVVLWSSTAHVTRWGACAYICMVMTNVMLIARCTSWSCEEHTCNHVNVHVVLWSSSTHVTWWLIWWLTWWP